MYGALGTSDASMRYAGIVDWNLIYNICVWSSHLVRAPNRGTRLTMYLYGGVGRLAQAAFPLNMIGF